MVRWGPMTDLLTAYATALVPSSSGPHPHGHPHDPAQEPALLALERLRRALLLDAASSRSPLPSRLLAGVRRKIHRLSGRPALRGVYLFGPVGRGKTFLMDLFYQSVEPSAELRPSHPSRRRLHFHTFMQDIHARLHKARLKGHTLEDVARTYAREVRLLCLDEFQITNVADALIMARLFGTLFEEGLVLVATSNTAPEDLYTKGLQRDLFLPFIPVLRRFCEPVSVGGAVDYRRQRIKGEAVYFCPPDVKALEHLFSVLTDGAEGAPLTLTPSGGRAVTLPRAAHGVAFFSAPEMDTQRLWIPEFQALADHVPTLLVSGLTPIREEENDRAERFITFIDVWYDRRAKLAVSAEVPPEGLYPSGPLHGRFARTLSRLEEMQTPGWWDLPLLAGSPEDSAG